MKLTDLFLFFEPLFLCCGCFTRMVTSWVPTPSPLMRSCAKKKLCTYIFYTYIPSTVVRSRFDGLILRLSWILLRLSWAVLGWPGSSPGAAQDVCWHGRGNPTTPPQSYITPVHRNTKSPPKNFLVLFSIFRILCAIWAQFWAPFWAARGRRGERYDKVE